jgi:hypothetical protein
MPDFFVLQNVDMAKAQACLCTEYLYGLIRCTQSCFPDDMITPTPYPVVDT